MASDTLSDFLADLEQNGELSRVQTTVSPILEISEISDRVSKSQTPHAHNELDRNPGGKLGGKALCSNTSPARTFPLQSTPMAAIGA